MNVRDTRGGKSIGVIGSNRITNEEAYLLQKFARTVLGTNNIDHHRTADYAAFAQALAGKTDRTASLRDTLTAPAIMILGGDPTIQAPATAWNIRTNVRNNRGRLYIANSAEIKLRRQAKAFAHIAPFSYGALASFIAGDDTAVDALTHPGADAASFHNFRKAIRAEESLLVLIGSEFRGADLKRLLDFGTTLPNRKFALLSDYANSRGAADMGLLPDLLPGYTPLGSSTFASTTPQPNPASIIARDLRGSRPRRTLCSLRGRLESGRPVQRRSRRRSKIPSSSCRRCSSPRPPLWLMSSFPPRTSMRNPAQSPTAMATFSSSTRPETVPESAQTSR